MNYIRTLVSGDKKRFVNNTYNLDLSYITPRVIAMAFPASGFEGLYRNSITDVSQFIQANHNENYMIINLSNRKYDYTKFHNKVKEYEWIDHHAPPLTMLFQICEEMFVFLNSNKDNVVFVNCQAGKGRTGTIICCFLLYSGLFTNPDDCFNYYSKKRFQKGQGVTQPSQRRYVIYFHQMLMNDYSFPFPIEIVGIYLNKPPQKILDNLKPFVQCYEKNSNRLIYTNEKSFKDQTKIFSNSIEMIQITDKLFNVEVIGDVTIKLYNKRNFKKDSKIGRVSFNTAFLNPKGDCFLKFCLKDIDPDNLVNNPTVPRDFEIIVKYKFKELCNNDGCSRDNFCEDCLKHGNMANDVKEWNVVLNIIHNWRNVKTTMSQSEKNVLLFGNDTNDIEQTIKPRKEQHLKQPHNNNNNNNNNNTNNNNYNNIILSNDNHSNDENMFVGQRLTVTENRIEKDLLCEDELEETEDYLNTSGCILF